MPGEVEARLRAQLVSADPEWRDFKIAGETPFLGCSLGPEAALKDGRGAFMANALDRGVARWGREVPRMRFLSRGATSEFRAFPATRCNCSPCHGSGIWSSVGFCRDCIAPHALASKV
eukprot:9243098-Pyramimonas_sp.AAC.1